MADRKLQALTLIQRIRRHEMEQEAAGLAELNLQISVLTRQKTALLEELHTQAHGRTLEAAPYVGNYVRAVRTEEARLTGEIAALEKQVAEREAVVMEHFRQMKAYGKVLDDTRAGQSREANRKEAAQADELTTLRWGRH